MTPEVNLRCGCGNGVFLHGGKGECSRCGKEALAPHLQEPLSACGVCGGRALYRQRDFNRNLGVAIATAACLAAFAVFLSNHWLVAMGILAGAAVLDLALYFGLPEVAVCYACAAVHRGFRFDPALQPYSLMLADLHEKRTGGPTHA